MYGMGMTNSRYRIYSDPNEGGYVVIDTDGETITGWYEDAETAEVAVTVLDEEDRKADEGDTPAPCEPCLICGQPFPASMGDICPDCRPEAMEADWEREHAAYQETMMWEAAQEREEYAMEGDIYAGTYSED